MIGAISSSLSLAQRTASKASATMDDMTRQIATGQRVSSVKDDGAAWTRANALRTQKIQDESRLVLTSIYRQVLGESEALFGTLMQAADDMKQAALGAISHAPGSSARQAYAAQYQHAMSQFWQLTLTPQVIVSGAADQPNGTWGIAANPNDPVLAGTGITTELGANPSYFLTATFSPTGTVPISADIVNGTNASLTSLIANVENIRSNILGPKAAFTGFNQNWVDRVEEYTEQNTHRLDTAIASLTEADLGKASTQRAQAEARQQLALSTIQQAISAYGNFAGGLLGNVQRTQRGVLA
jgi:flagellin-like hook-associated protein FlgL